MSDPILHYEMRLDFKILRDQKLYLLEVIEAEWTSGTANREAGHVLNGLVSMIDDLQDQAVKQGISEQEVFGDDYASEEADDRGRGDSAETGHDV